VLVFIDESGDPGFKVQKGSTPDFTAALVAFQDVEQARLAQKAIEAMAARLRVYPEFKFSKCRPEVKDAFFAAVLPYKFYVRAIVVQKEKIYGSIPARAGEPARDPAQSVLARVHPRAGGGASTTSASQASALGPSPRGRGSQFRT
jgi:hypothetical protein